MGQTPKFESSSITESASEGHWSAPLDIAEVIERLSDLNPEVHIDAPYLNTGTWLVDLNHKGRRALLSWTPQNDIGEGPHWATDARDTLYGEGHDEVWPSAELAALRLRGLLTHDWETWGFEEAQGLRLWNVPLTQGTPEALVQRETISWARSLAQTLQGPWTLHLQHADIPLNPQSGPVITAGVDQARAVMGCCGLPGRIEGPEALLRLAHQWLRELPVPGTDRVILAPIT